MNVEVKCAKSVDCSASTQNNLNYFIDETTELTIPACVVSPGICANTILGTLTSTGSTTAPGGFATMSKNANGSFKILLTSSDASKAGESYTFTLGFSDLSLDSTSLTLPSALSFNVAVKCTKVADCSSSVLSDIAYFYG